MQRRRARRRPGLEHLEARTLLDSSGLLHFDFGTAASPVAADHAHLPGTLYSQGLGYGWSASVRMFDRGASAGNDWQRDINTGTDRLFRVDLPNGLYDVTPVIGDPTQARDKVWMWLEGQRIYANYKSAAGRFYANTFQVLVQDGRLDMHLRDNGGVSNEFAIAALRIVPVGGLKVNAGADQSANEGTAVSFAGTAAGTGTLTYAWDFGDGATASGTLTPKHAYADNGTYTAKLTVTDGAGRASSDTLAVRVANVAPTASAGGPYAATAGTAVKLTATATDPSSADQAAGFTYAWAFGDGTTGTGAAPSHTYANPGTYTASVEATDKDGGTSVAAVATVVVTSTGGGPTVNAGADQSANEGAAVSFAGTASGTGTLTYAWDFGDGATASGTLTPKYTYADNGTYTARLTVTDGSGRSSSDTLVVRVANVAPTASAGGPYAATAGTAVKLTATATDPSSADQAAGFTYAWAFGDGTTGTGVAPSHTYANPGTYTASVKATDKDGGTSVAAMTTVVVSSVTTGPFVPIDNTWLSARGAGPYYLDQADTTYRLMTDVTVNGTAFVVLNSNITFDLNGHTITYGNAAPLAVPNGGFEQGSSSTDIPGWDVSGAPGAVRVAARTGMWGSWMLRVPNVSTTRRIVSQSIAVPVANVEYAAAITPRAPSGSTVTLSVIDAATNAVLGSSSSREPNRGFSAVVRFVPKTTNPVKLQVTIQPPSGSTATVDLDYASLTRSRDYGVVASRAYWSLPAHLQTSAVVNNSQKAQGVTVQGGTIRQGQSRGFAGSPIYATSAAKPTIQNVTLEASGMDTNLIDMEYASNLTIKGSRLVGKLDRISDRMRLFAGISVQNVGGTVLIQGNTMEGTLHTGVTIYRDGSDRSQVTIKDNIIRHNSLGTDGYGIVVNNLKNFVISGNTVQPINGRGILFDGFSNGSTEDGLIQNNVFEARERPNLEYSANAMEATALRIRNFSSSRFRNLTFTGNTFFAETGPGADWAAIGARLTLVNGSGQMNGANLRFQNNVFRAVLNGIDPNTGSAAWALSLSTLHAGTGTTFVGNRFESNDISINSGDNDGWDTPVEDVTFVGNTVAKLASNIGRTYRGVVVGDMRNSTKNLRLFDTRYEGGASPGIQFVGSKPSDVSVGWLVDVRAVNGSGAAVSGATVSILDKSNGQVFTGQTDANGRITGIAVVTTVYRQTGTSSSQITTDARGPFTVKVANGTSSTSRSVTIDRNLDLTLTL